jgi:hypothetical protein
MLTGEYLRTRTKTCRSATLFIINLRYTDTGRTHALKIALTYKWVVLKEKKRMDMVTDLERLGTPNIIERI